MSKKHGWIITWSNPEIIGDEVGTMGPRSMTATADEIKAQGQAFRMYDADGEHYYDGFNLGGSGFEPLDDFGMPNAGCTDIKYQQGGAWSSL